MLAHKEIELKFPLTENEYHSLIEKLSGSYERTDLNQNDFVIKTKSGENVRVRREEGRSLLTHKKKIYAPDGAFLYCRESESLIDAAHEKSVADIIAELGIVDMPLDICANVDVFQKWLENALATQKAYSVHLHKNRTEFKEGDYTYVLDHVENLGYFLEIEYLVPLNDLTEETKLRSQMRQKLPELGISDRENIIHGYTVLMHEKEQNAVK